MADHDVAAVEVRDLVKMYPRPGGGSIRALDGITFWVRAGEFFGFLGPNGAGKTTALEIIEGIRKPTSGAVRVLGIDPRRELDKGWGGRWIACTRRGRTGHRARDARSVHREREEVRA